MTRIAIVEDDFSSAELVNEYVEKIKKEYGLEIECYYFENGLKFLDSFNCSFDIVLMDIEMPDMNGMEVAKRLRQIDNEVCLIFITNLAQYAINGYEVDALDFMVKPVSYYQFATKLRRAVNFANKSKESQLMLNVEKEFVRISLKDLLFVEVQRHLIIYHTYDGEYTIKNTSMKKVEENLEPYGFIRCNNCFLVNLKHVARVQKNTVFIGPHELQISNPRRKTFLKNLTTYLSRGGLSINA